jgi:hypothetical protein
VFAHVIVEATTPIPLALALEPNTAGGRVRIVRSIVLAAQGTSTDDLAAHRPGAVVWQEARGQVTTIVLEQEVVRLSTEAIDFSHLPDADPAAAWQLDVDLADLHASPSRALQLFANTTHPMIHRLLSDDQNDASRLVQSVLRWDVARQLVERALEEDDFVEDFGEFLPDSVGGAMQRFFTRWLPDTTPTELRDLRRQHPSRFEALLQARLRMLRVP